MAMEKGKERPEWPASREADPKNTEQQAGLSGDNDADRIQTNPPDKEATDKAYLENTTGAGESAGANQNVKEA
jgi:hypothetical protein